MRASVVHLNATYVRNAPVTYDSSIVHFDLVVPRTRLARYGPRGFAVSAPVIWNSLPPDLSDRGVYPPNTLEQCPSSPSPSPLPSLSLPLEVDPLIAARGLGSALAPPAGPGRARPPNGIW